jgi:homoserine kinase
VLHRHPVEVVAPATSANLGPGFDSLGLALSLYDRLRVRVLDAGLQVEVQGVCADDVPRDEKHLVVRAMRAAFGQMGLEPPGLSLHCSNGIPHGRGLGSSAAAIVGGIVAARALVSDGSKRLPDAAALELAAGMEGHPDNVAACLLGGLTVAWSDDRTSAGRAIRLDAVVRAVALIPEQPVATHIARALLPPSVAQRDAAANAGRAALLVAALSGEPALRTSEVLLAATRDWLHQDARASAMPCSMDLVVGLRERGHAAVVSGAGPSVLVLLAPDGDADDACRDLPDGWHCRRLDVDQRGARVVTT